MAWVGALSLACSGRRGPYRPKPIVATQRRKARGRMSVRIRKLVGTVMLFILVAVWALLAMALAQSALTDVNYWVAALYYLIAGMGWILPAMPLIRWMYAAGRRMG
jgi:hypothetical protein